MPGKTALVLISGAAAAFVLEATADYYSGRNSPSDDAAVRLAAPTNAIAGAPLIEFEVSLHNEGVEDVRIENLRSSCTCVAEIQGSLLIAAGQSLSVPIRYRLLPPDAPDVHVRRYPVSLAGDIAGRAGRWSAEGTVSVVWPVIIKPWELCIDGQAEADCEGRVRLGAVMIASAEGIRDPRVVSAPPWIETAVSSRSGAGYDLILYAVSSDAVPAAFDVSLDVSAGMDQAAKVRIHGSKYPAIRVSPTGMHFGMVKSMSSHEFHVAVSNPGTAVRRITLIPDEDVSVVSPAEPGVSIAPGSSADVSGVVLCRGTGHQLALIRIETPDDAAPALVPLSWFAED